MRIDLDIRRMVPAFLMADRNGYALAKALEAGLTDMLRIIEQSVREATDVDSMPEWRMDEVAWETNCLYDYTADIEQKREWIREAMPSYKLYGTPFAIKHYLEGTYPRVTVDEDRQPYHFKVEVEGDWSAAREVQVLRAIEKVKNLRSTLDGVQFQSNAEAQIYVGYALHGVADVQMQMEAADLDWLDSVNLLTDETGELLLDETGYVLYEEANT